MSQFKNISIVNIMEPIVIHIFEDTYLKHKTLKCSCDKCQLDIILLTLNHLPPHYTSTLLGETYVKTEYMTTQTQSDVLSALARAAQIIEERPNHD
ncbi:MAG: late competence development ComFB family protein [Candidatus Cohnella colombiensis]|uniref:Late competence development ComFB family protein n=1 Tax=Candidatus Cohnella colombiensis TaxID=3121368 RepID=A0AA95EV68_9BACL|nr:MAG: late competence development ComFB family protein [Cohnella sp.]